MNKTWPCEHIHYEHSWGGWEYNRHDGCYAAVGITEYFCASCGAKRPDEPKCTCDTDECPIHDPDWGKLESPKTKLWEKMRLETSYLRSDNDTWIAISQTAKDEFSKEVDALDEIILNSYPHPIRSVKELLKIRIQEM